MPAKVNRQNLSEHLFEKQLSIIGKTVQDAINVRHGSWRDVWDWRQVHADELRNYAIPLIKKVFKCNKSKAEKTFDFFLINFGLRVYNT